MLLISAFWGGSRRRRRFHRRILREFNRALLLIQDRSAVEATLSARIRELLPVSSLLVLHLVPELNRFVAGYSLGSVDPPDTVEIDRHGRLTRWILVNESHSLLRLTPEVVEHLEPPVRELLGLLGTHACVPLITQGQPIGLVLLTLEDAEHTLYGEDREVLEVLAQQGALALENARLYEEQELRLKRLHRTERLAAVGQLAAGAAHEIRNPLTAIRSTMQYLERGEEEEGRKEMIGELLEEVDRINDTVSQLLQLTREEKFDPESLDPVELLEATVHLIESQADKQGVVVHERFPKPAPRIQGDSDSLRKVFLNLALNALQAMPDGGDLTLSLEASNGQASGGHSWAEIGISDTGHGIDPEALEKIFDPFYTTKPDGTGLGLAISHRIVERHEGELSVESDPREGTTFLIRLPSEPWPES